MTGLKKWTSGQEPTVSSRKNKNKDFHDVLQRLNKICLKLSEEQNPRLVREIRKTVKQLQELYLNMDSVCTIQFEKGGDAE